VLEFLSRGKLTTLLFHKLPPTRQPLVPSELALSDFAAVLESTLKHFRVLPLDDAVNSLRAGNLPPKAACITFDDGYAEWRDGVLPLLERHGVHATFFVTSGQFSGQPMWTERILQAVSQAPELTKPLQLDNSKLPLLYFDDTAARKVTIQKLDEILKYQEPERREQLLSVVERHTGFVTARTPLMSVADLRHLHSRGFGIGAHSITHPILSCCSQARAYEEIGGSKEQLESIIRGKVMSFTYPNGAPGKDFGGAHIDMVKRAGYRCALTTLYGTARANTSLYQIPRFTPWGPTATRMKIQFARNLIRRPLMISEINGPEIVSA